MRRNIYMNTAMLMKKCVCNNKERVILNKYESLLDNAEQDNVEVIENYPFESNRFKGLYCDGVIVLGKNIRTNAEKACILAEELGHHYTAVGDILDQSSVANRKQEMRGRILAYNRLVGLRGIVDAYNHHCQGISEAAEYLGVTEEFLNDTVSYYKSRYGTYTTIDNYGIIFEPTIAVMELI